MRCTEEKTSEAAAARYADLHIHTHFSDGTQSPEQVAAAVAWSPDDDGAALPPVLILGRAPRAEATMSSGTGGAP